MPEALSFIDFRIIDIIDILIVAVVLYQLYRLAKGTAAVKLFWVVVIFYIIWKVVEYFHFTLLSGLLGEVINVGILAIIILFAPEIRKFLLYIGDGRLMHWFSDKFGKQEKDSAYLSEVEAVREACHHMSDSMTGALIVFARKTPLDDFINSGKTIDALPTPELLENIFFKNSPLHDGAMIIVGDRIEAAACILPLSQSEELPKSFGLRHRSAMGIAEKTNAVAVVVSEETGYITVFHKGSFRRGLTTEELARYLAENVR